MATAGTVINRALRLIGVLAEGETTTGEQASTALLALNQMLDSWSAERLSVYSTQDQVFTWPANTASRTLGPSGDFVGNRPILLDDATYFKVNNLSYGVKLINQQQYDGIALKSATSTYPQVLFANMAMPDMEMYVYPVPTTAIEFHFISVEELSQPPALATTLVLPPGYLRALSYCLAVEVAPEYGVEAPPTVQRIAVASKRTLKRINNPDDILAMPYPLVASRQRFNIFSGNF
jgi:hypothetical protein